MKNTNQSDQIKVLEAKIDRLQRSITKLEKKLTDHIAFIDRVYEPLRNPISKRAGYTGPNLKTRILLKKRANGSVDRKNSLFQVFAGKRKVISVSAIFFAANMSSKG